jgi:hypothetical protein
MESFKKLLVRLGACKEAKDWVGDKTLEVAWTEAIKPDWMFWLYERSKRLDGLIAASLAMRFASNALRSAGLADEAEKLTPYLTVTLTNCYYASRAANYAASYASRAASRAASYASCDAASCDLIRKLVSVDQLVFE